MLFNTIDYALFFPAVVCLYFLIPHRFRWVLLLAASYYFYMCWKAEYIILIIASTLVDYVAAKQMFQAQSQRGKRLWLGASLLSNLGMLFTFKYFNFFTSSIHDALASVNIFYEDPVFQLMLPVGISFYTFQTLSYTIDVYRGEREPENHLGIFAVYVSFFPQLVAGPIERSTRLIPQFFEKHEFDYDRVVSGLRQMLWGLFMKMVVADRAGIYVDAIYNNQEHHNGVSLLLATFMFAFQIYGDFAGYSHIAIGSARVMGFDLMENFRKPYFSASVREFWGRWHISLSTWFRDYVYIPLGGNRVVKWRWYYNLFITFLISGLWHGANWTFVIWGALHGGYLVFALMTKDIREGIKTRIFGKRGSGIQKTLEVLTTFALVCLAWIFFRANTVTDAFEIVGKVLTPSGSLFFEEASQVLYPLLMIGLLLTVEFYEEIGGKRIAFFQNRYGWVRHVSYAMVVLMIILFGVLDAGQFIYFQF